MGAHDDKTDIAVTTNGSVVFMLFLDMRCCYAKEDSLNFLSVISGVRERAILRRGSANNRHWHG
jgi:hypothetical protein